MAPVTLKIIGHFRGKLSTKSALPRQAHLSSHSGYIEFSPGFDHKLALKGLEDMSHCWLIFIFHEAKSKAKPLVKPPRAPHKLIGVYATRAPYRPNPIGLSLVQIEKIEKGKLYLKNCDLISDTPLLDIKPYVKEADSAVHPKHGWIDEVENWTFHLSKMAESKISWLKQSGFHDLENVLTAQLTTSPHQKSRKRLKKISEENFILSYRTWRIHLKIDDTQKSIEVLDLNSGYTRTELKKSEDPYSDKDLHRRFTKCFVCE
ncbi:MAG: tRNA (N6-threonylcarbamoyladenosine(37)-N6)-methyltransferase TrmO [Bdellovibrionales bacterium]